MRTTRSASLLAFLLAAGIGSAQEPQPPPPQQPPSKTAPQPSATKEIAAQVVSSDQQAKTITVKKEDAAGTPAAAETTLAVEAAAMDALKTVRPGEKVRLICKTDSSGKETAVTAINKERPKN